jgi:hypothetical protein
MSMPMLSTAAAAAMAAEGEDEHSEFNGDNSCIIKYFVLLDESKVAS